MSEQDESPATQDRNSLREKSVKGGIVTVAAKIICIVCQLASTVVLARLVSPKDYGLVAMATSTTSLLGLVKDFGLSSAAVQRAELSQSLQSNLFWLNLSLGGLLTGLTALAAPLVAKFFGEPELTKLILLLSLTFILSSVGIQPWVSLTRKLYFGKQSFAMVLGTVTGLALSLVLALRDYGYWSLAWGTVASLATKNVTLTLLSPFRPSSPRFDDDVKSMLKFGANVTAFDITTYLQRNFDKIVIGKLLSASTLGLYSRAHGLLALPLSAVRDPMTAVTLPALSKLQDQPNAFRSYYCNMLTLVSLAALPITAFSFAASDLLIGVALGNDWTDTAPIFRILSIGGFIQTPVTFLGVLLLSLGQTKKYVQFGIAQAVTICIGVALGIPNGINGVAIGYSMSIALSFLPIITYFCKETPVSATCFLRAISRPLFASLIAGGLTAIISFDSITNIQVIALTLKLLLFGLSFLATFSAFPNGRQQITSYMSLVLKGKKPW